MTVFVDTGYLLALLNPRDSLHRRAQAWAHVIREPLLTTEYVMWELINGFSMPADRPKAHFAVRQIRYARDWQWVPATSELFESGLKLHSNRMDKAWSLTDCISFHIMQRQGIQQALAYDHHFEQAGFDALLRRDPP